ncbi:MAG: signal peptide peptidase SppA [Phycisphaera sp.]|nr:signal peptide peptidase SppA [Phycisphaera sp.]
MDQTPHEDPSRNPAEPGRSSRGPVDPRGMTPPPPPPPAYMPMYPPPQPARRGGIASRVMTGLISSLLIASLVANIYLGAYFAAMVSGDIHESVYEKGDKTQRIVVLPVSGLIDDDSARFVRKALKALREDLPKAIVLRVDSGGGTVSASDRIWHELKTFRKETGVPIVASFGSMAASGGYYISSCSDKIIAEPTGVTGSIGVMAPIMTFQGLLDKVGVTPEVLVADGSPKKDVANNVLRKWDDNDRAEVKAMLNHAYARFVSVVAEGRAGHLTDDEVKQLADGSVFTTEQAITNKLIDGEGYLEDAINEAKQLAKIGSTVSPQVSVIGQAQPISLLNLIGWHSAPAAAIDSQSIQRWVSELQTPRLEYRYTVGF